MVTGKRIRYRDAGVNIDEADRAVGAIKKMAQRTFTRGVLTDIGTFGACYALSGMEEAGAGQLGGWRGHEAQDRVSRRAGTTLSARIW